ncbi:hypothetical protein EUX98_g1863 [Antrodiella citrinella]|uniref:Translin n=1 Tax=Antrodiella citrinella TaxID=2447956 RepID=A0A4S4N2Q4_9APHY|nr:hypothetical protein EUX98_g1863 [Antrodiella citrinella]
MSVNTSSSRDAVVAVFDVFRIELDEHNDRRERLIKSSRDITNLSKKAIFLLHRVMTDDAHTDDKDDSRRNVRAAARGREKLKEIQKLFAVVGTEVEGDRFWRYQKNVSPGLQEYIEALSFTHYLETGKLVSYDEVQQTLSHESEDYLLGLSDLTGELMRYAISAISQQGGRTKANEVCAFVRDCKSYFDVYTTHFRELRKKQQVTTQSLEKIEDAAYAIAVRTSEYDIPPELLDDIVARSVVSEGGGNSGRKRTREGEFDEGDLDRDQ